MKLRVLQPYQGWASGEVYWPKGAEVKVDDTEPAYELDGKMLTTAQYLLKVQGDSFVELKARRKAKEPEV